LKRLLGLQFGPGIRGQRTWRRRVPDDAVGIAPSGHDESRTDEYKALYSRLDCGLSQMGRALHVRALCHRDGLGALFHVGMAGKVHDGVTPGQGALQIRVLAKISIFDPI
jgi:hypothetical protein